VDDVNGMAKACIEVLGSPELRRAMGKAAQERMTTMFSPDVMVTRIYSLFVTSHECAGKGFSK
jgi:glycosyltransferase involved in cell wall biosynthesis